MALVFQHELRVLLTILCAGGGVSAQTTALSLSPATVAPGDAALFTLSLDASAGVPPSALQWTFQYTSAGVSSITVEDGPALTSAGKTAICAGGAQTCTCLAVGANAEMIADGAVAKVIVVLAPGVTEAQILVDNALGVSAGGDPIWISTTNGTITTADVLPMRKRSAAPARRGR